MTIEYELTTGNDELVGVFNWSELREYFKGVSMETLKASYRRGTLLLGCYHLSQVKYDENADY